MCWKGFSMADLTTKPPPQPSAPQEDEVVERRTLRDYYIILRERLWIALPLALLISVGYCYKRLQVTPTYSAQATMQFEKPDTVVLTQGVVDQSIRGEFDLGTIIDELRSNKVRGRVIESFSPEEKKILERAAAKATPPSLLGTVVPVPRRSSYIIEINVNHYDPEAAALVANRYLTEYMGYKYDTAGGKTDEGIDQLKDAEQRLRKDWDEAAKALQAFVIKNNLPSMEGALNIASDGVRKSAAAREEASQRLRAYEEKMRQIDTYKAENKDLLEISEIAGNPAVAGLRAKLIELRQTENLLADRYYERHPTMVDLANKKSAMEADLNRAIDSTIAEIRARLDEARQSLKNAEADSARYEKESLRLGDLKIEFDRMQREVETFKSQYDSVVKRRSDVQTRKNIDKVPVHSLDRALPNPTPTAPNKSDITRTGVGIFVLVFLGVAVGLSFVDDRIKSAWDVESFIGANLLGIIPDLASLKDEEKYRLLLDGKESPGVEAFLSVYSSIKIHSKLDFPKSILVTSTIPGEGKTLISCNVAGAFARHGKKTLLIDCDLRRPMLHRHFKQENSAGLLPWFESGAMLEGDLANHPLLGITKVGENLSLLSSGGRSKSPTELLEHPLFGQLLERLKREFDLIIVDSPPLGAVTDSLLIAERIDEVVYVCRFNRAYRKHIRLFMRQLRNGKNEVLGIVLNGLSPRRIEYYSNYRYYRSYKKYYGAQQ